MYSESDNYGDETMMEGVKHVFEQNSQDVENGLMKNETAIRLLQNFAKEAYGTKRCEERLYGYI